MMSLPKSTGTRTDIPINKLRMSYRLKKAVGPWLIIPPSLLRNVWPGLALGVVHPLRGLVIMLVLALALPSMATGATKSLGAWCLQRAGNSRGIEPVLWCWLFLCPFSCVILVCIVVI